MRRLVCAVAVLCAGVLLSVPVNASVVISEILTENAGGLRDSEGESQDWIELHNRSAASVSLAGWHLTDTPTNLTRWPFPNVTMGPGAYLVVFASGKNRTNALELHTNFRLNNSGGYVALVQPNGATIEHTLAYGRQRANVSYGTGTSNTLATLVASNAAVRWLVPTNDASGQSWTSAAFHDAGWATAPMPLRFNVLAGGSTPVLSLDVNARANNTAGETQAEFSSFIMQGSSGIQTGPITRTYGGISVTLSNSATGIGYDDRLRTAPSNGGSFTLQHILRDFIFSREQTGTSGLDIHVTGLVAGQEYEFSIWSFDVSSSGSRVSDWFANGVMVTNNYTFNGSVSPTSDTHNRIVFRGNANASGTVVISGRRDSTSVDGANAASFGVFWNGLQITPLDAPATTNGNVAAMAGQNASLYSRAAFNLANPSQYDSLRLRIRYNDGFIAYLNGTEIARRNAPASPAHNSAATATNSANVLEEIVLPGGSGLLASGNNVLALHGLNIAATNSDFFLQAELLAVQTVEFTNRYFATPTPGADNEPGFLGLVADTKFSVDRGFFEQPFSLSITTATVGAQIRYTTNGSAPSTTNGLIFSSPISITGHSFIRAAAFLPNHISSDIDTHSYIFLRDVLRQSNNIPGYPGIWAQASYPADYEMDPNVVNHPFYGATLSNDLRAIPVLSIVMDHDGLWGSTRGIYMFPTSTHDLAAGRDWERAASAELILPNGVNGKSAFAVNCAIRIQGNASRDNVRTPKHSFRLLFKGGYGPTKLAYDWFPGRVAEFDNIVLRAVGFVDAWPSRYSDTTLYTNPDTGETYRGARYRPETGTYLRDIFVKDSHRDMGWTASRSDWVHLYINGLYWGIYNPSERLDSAFMANHFGGWEQDWDVLVGDDNVFNAAVADGSKDDWNAMLALVNAGITSESAYAAVTNLVDVDSLIDYMLLHIYIEAEDWPHHNWYAAHRRANPTNGLPATKWQFFTWDQEVSLDRHVRRDRTSVGASGNTVDSPARIYAQLRAWPEFRRQFGDRVQKHLFNGGALTPSNNVARFSKLAAAITNAIVAESARWGDAREFPTPGNSVGTGQTFTRDEWWVPELHKLWTNLFPALHNINITRLRNAQLFPGLNAPAFNQFGGAVSNGFELSLSHNNGAGLIYFTTDGRDPRQYSSGAVDPSAQAYSAPVSINAPTLVRARVLNGSTWSALVETTFYPPQDLRALALTELMYNPSALGAIGSDELEFLELKNVGTNTLNLSGLTFSGITFTFTNGTLLAPGQFFVLARNASAFASKYPGVMVNGIYTGRLDNGGETITLSHALGGTIFALTYDDVAPWPVTADGHGFSIVPRFPGMTQAPDDGSKWRASTYAGGSPGADDPAPFIAPIVVNEILTHTASAQVDMVELFNPTTTNVNIGGWFLTDDAAVPRKYRIAENTIIAPNGYVLLDESHFNPTNGSFAFSASGEQVYLFSGDANTNLTGYSHGFSFGAAEQGYSFGRYINSIGEEQFPAQRQVSFGFPNAGPRIGPVVINEIHYNPAPGDDEFVELKNISGYEVNFTHHLLPGSTWQVNGIGFSFPSNVVLQPQALLLVVPIDPAVFASKYSVPANVQVLGPYSGVLQDSGERIELLKPDAQSSNAPPYIVVDSVRYNDKAPWPPAADGSGASLQRRLPHHYGDDPINWLAALPTPGRELDTDGDGIPDAWEIENGTNPNVADANLDSDGDGISNLDEYRAGTNPLSAQSRMKIDQVRLFGGSVELRFTVPSNRVFRVLFKDSLDAPNWSLLQELPLRTQTRQGVVFDPATNGSRFYRVTTP